jgi:gluconokinase
MKTPRTPHDTIHGLVYFPRMVEKIRLHTAGELAEDCVPNLGKGFDDRCCRFLGVPYEELAAKVKEGLDDESLWAWAVKRGSEPTAEQIEVWNGFMSKRGWRDEANEILIRRKKESGFENQDEIQTMFDYIDADEGRAISKS